MSLILDDEQGQQEQEETLVKILRTLQMMLVILKEISGEEITKEDLDE